MKRIIIFAALAVTPTAWAGNDEAVFLGNDAAMVGGAVVAITDDASAAWYNPAGLAAQRRSRFDLTATAVAVRFRKTDVVLRYAGDQASAPISSVSVVVIPSSIVYIRPIAHQGAIALGVFVPLEDQFSDVPVIDSTLGDRRVRGSAHIDTNVIRYHAGGTVGFPLGRSVRVGGGAYVLFEQFKNQRQASIDVSPPGVTDPSVQDDALLLSDLTVESRRIGGELVGGVQWTASPRWHFGATLRSPALLLHHTLDARYQESTVVPGAPAVTRLDPEPVPKQTIGMMLPARLAIGGALRLARGYVSAEVGLAHGLDRPGNELTSLWNVRAGIRQQVTTKTAIGFGVFSDRSAQPRPTEFYSDRIHYYGASAGIELDTRLPLRRQRDHVSLKTTLGIRYAIGVGEATGVAVDIEPILAGGVGDSHTSPVHHAVYQEAAFHLGTAIAF